MASTTSSSSSPPPSSSSYSSSSSSSSPPPPSSSYSSSDSSRVPKTCFYCNEETAKFTIGWQLRNGGFAELCDRCGSAYEDGKFCEIFHLDADGWRDCAYCGKMVHCGCIMSFHIFTLLDFGGVNCMECFEISGDQPPAL